MDESTKLCIFFSVFLVLLAIDYLGKYKDCIVKTPLMMFELALHRLINVFIYLGWIFNNKYVLGFYLIFNISLCIHWSLNNGRCCLTLFENQVCNFKKGTMYDYVFQVFDMKTATTITVIIKCVILITVLYKLYYDYFLKI